MTTISHLLAWTGSGVLENLVKEIDHVLCNEAFNPRSHWCLCYLVFGRRVAADPRPMKLLLPDDGRLMMRTERARIMSISGVLRAWTRRARCSDAHDAGLWGVQ